MVTSTSPTFLLKARSPLDLMYLFTADAGVGAGQKRPPRLSYSACSGPGGSRFANWANWANGLNGLRAELGRLNMENADLKSQLKERDARIAKLESVLEESRRAGKRQAAPFSKDKPKTGPEEARTQAGV